MADVFPTVNLRITLELTRGERRLRYASTVLEFGPARLVIALPSVRAQWVSVEVGSKVDVVYTSIDGAYRLSGRVSNRHTDPPARLDIDWLGPVRREQRRAFVRVQLSIAVKYRHKQAETSGVEGQNATWCEGRLRDLSAGGMLLVPEVPVSMGDVLDLAFEIEGQKILAGAEVVRSVRVEELDTVGVGLKFLNLPPAVEDRIVGYLFREQVRRRKEGRD